MDAMQFVVSELQRFEGDVTSQILSDLIEAHKPKREEMIKNYERYKASVDGVPIMTRSLPDSNKVNNKLNNDFYSEIITTKIGYFVGKPIVYNLDKSIESQKEVIERFNVLNAVNDLDSETVKFMSICGYGSRLYYIDKKARERMMNVPSWETIFIYDSSLDELQYGMRYYKITVKEGAQPVDKWLVEWYDEKYVSYFIESQGGKFIPYNMVKVNIDGEEVESNKQEHFFTGVPLIEFPNNEERQGDCDKVLQLIDGYDRTLSDMNSEIEQFRLAYMYFKGHEPDEKTIAKAKQTGAFGIDEDGEIGFITKEMNADFIEKHLDRLENNILRFANSVNFTDEAFGGNLSGVAMKYKLFGLETKCMIAENKFRKSLLRQFELLASVWGKKAISIDPLKVWYEFKRNLAMNVKEEAETTGLLKGNVSERTRLGLLTFVDDVEFELEEMAKDRESIIDLDAGDDA